MLESSAFSDEVFGVLVNGWPKESALLDLGLSTVYTIVFPIRCRMTLLNVGYFSIMNKSASARIPL